ncbi:MAG TPA: hypothetical protein VGO03_21355 [Acidimicrobiia bacterium]
MAGSASQPASDVERVARVLLSVPSGAARAALRTAGSAAARATEFAIEAAASAVETFVRVLDVNGLLAGVDLDALLRRVDVQALLDRIDLDSMLRRVDLDALLRGVDVNDLIARIDVDTLVEETDVGAVIARSTGSVASGAVDLMRRQGVNLDDAVARIAMRLRPRRLSTNPGGPPGLVAGQGAT